jgi:hypothetical protein
MTNNGAFSFGTLSATFFENIVVDAGSGTATLGAVIGMNENNFSITAGAIRFTAPIDPFNALFISTNDSILNVTIPVLITATNSILFNALEGDVGSVSSPILIQTGNQIFAGAGSGLPAIAVGGVPRDHKSAILTGTSIDDTVHAIPSNPPCILTWNGVTLNDCGLPPPPPPPPPGPPSPPSNLYDLFFTTGRGLFIFAAPGFDSSYFNLSSDYYFRSFYSDEFLRKPNPLFYR